MCKVFRTVVVMVALLWAIGSQSGFCDVQIPHVHIAFGPVSRPVVAGPVEVALEVSHTDACSNLRIWIDTTERLLYNGHGEWNVSLEPNSPFKASFVLQVPADDTSHITVCALGTCGERLIDGLSSIYFITTGDTVEVYGGDPRGLNRHPESNRPVPSSGRRDEELPKPGVVKPGTIRLMAIDKDGKLVPVDSVPKDTSVADSAAADTTDRPRSLLGPNGEVYIWKQETDGRWVSLGESTPERRDSLFGPRQQPRAEDTLSGMALMRELEKTPYTGGTGQRMRIDGELYVRYEGEQKFHKVEPIADIEAYRRERRKKQGAKPDTVRHHVTMDLRNRSDYEFVDSLVDTLNAMERPERVSD